MISKLIAISEVLVIGAYAYMPITALGRDRYSALSMRGESYADSCLKAERSALKNQLMMSRENAKQGWRAIEKILCGHR
jgi:hypothetical protein